MLNISKNIFSPSFRSEWNKADVNIHNAESFMYIKSFEIHSPIFITQITLN